MFDVIMMERVINDPNVVKWLGYVEHMGEKRLINRVYEADVEGRKGRARACLK